MTITEIKSMPVTERIILMEEIWDTLCHETEEIKSPDWHEGILKSRLELLKSNSAELITLQQFRGLFKDANTEDVRDRNDRVFRLELN